MAVLRQVTFRFPSDTQIRYVERSPRRGDGVRGLHGEFFIVLHTVKSDAGELATCVSTVEYARATRRTARRILERARAECTRANDLTARTVTLCNGLTARGGGGLRASTG